MLEITAKQNFWVARCDWGFSNEEGIHANVHLETPTQNYFLEMQEFPILGPSFVVAYFILMSLYL